MKVEVPLASVQKKKRLRSWSKPLKIASSNPYGACAAAHGTVTSKKKPVNVPDARFNPAENDDD